MTNFIIIAVISFLVNTFLIWYVVRLLQKLLFISDNIADLFIITRSFELFAKNLYTMDSYNGEPMIQELIHRIKDVTNEIEMFRDTFEYTLDEETEEELYDSPEEAYTPQEVEVD
tara:strand:- start:1118 stop:1462 length:345 start_codon:yes stop_codon:yes gene_type:complete